MASRKKQNLIGRGLYSIPQAARLVGVHYNTLRYWIGDSRKQESLVKRDCQSLHLLTFSELMELHFVKMFKDKNVSIQTIRKTAKAASKKFRADHPFAVKRFDTDGKTIFATLQKKETDKEMIEDLSRGQLVFEQIIRPFFRKLDYHKNEVGRFWPLEKDGRIVLDPHRQFGQPIDSQTGVPTESLVSALSAGGGQDVKTVADWFDVPLEAVKAAIKFDRSLAT